jgi:hypothetical protein
MSKHVDLMGHPLEIGDLVAYPTGGGSSKYMCVAEILEFIDADHPSRWCKGQGWHARLQPLFWNDFRSTKTYSFKDGKYVSEEHPPKQVKVGNVQNFVKVVPPSGEEG